MRPPAAKLSDPRRSVGFVITGEVSAVAQLCAAVDALLAEPVDGLAARELASLIESVEVQRRRLEAVDQKLLAGAWSAHLPAELGRAGLADVLSCLLRVDVREARARVTRATDLGPRCSLTGEPLEPVLPVAAEAVGAGVVSGEQVDVIVACLEKIPPTAPAAAWPIAERVLVEAARFEGPRQLRRTAAELLARLDPDGIEPAEDAGRTPPRVHPGQEAGRHLGPPGVVDGRDHRPVGGDPRFAGRPPALGRGRHPG